MLAHGSQAAPLETLKVKARSPSLVKKQPGKPERAFHWAVAEQLEQDDKRWSRAWIQRLKRDQHYFDGGEVWPTQIAIKVYSSRADNNTCGCKSYNGLAAYGGELWVKTGELCPRPWPNRPKPGGAFCPLLRPPLTSGCFVVWLPTRQVYHHNFFPRDKKRQIPDCHRCSTSQTVSGAVLAHCSPSSLSITRMTPRQPPDATNRRMPFSIEWPGVVSRETSGVLVDGACNQNRVRVRDPTLVPAPDNIFPSLVLLLLTAPTGEQRGVV